MAECKEFEFFRGKVRFKQPKSHRLSIVEILFVANLKGVKKNYKVLDLGAGFGALSILIALRHGCQVYALERDPLMLELLRYNVEANHLEEKVRIIDLDLKHIKNSPLRPQSFDLVVANPPFYKGLLKANVYHHEKDTNLEDFIKAGSYLLKDGKGFNLLMASNRLIEVINYMLKHNLGVESIRFFYPRMDKVGKIMHLYALKNLKPTITIEKPLIINELSGEYTQEVKSIFDSFL
ncbi:MAG: tRNA1(Val) (adenine(37)-N6)-methyltransferase [Aquificaceae bacterium]